MGRSTPWRETLAMPASSRTIPSGAAQSTVTAWLLIDGKTGERKTRGQSSGCSFALHIPCAVPAMIVSSESSKVSKSASNCRRRVVFPVGQSECMYWSTDMWNIVTSWMNRGKLGYCPSFSTDCKCLAEIPSSSANSSLVILCCSRAFIIACPNYIKSKFVTVSLIFTPPILIFFTLYIVLKCEFCLNDVKSLKTGDYISI